MKTFKLGDEVWRVQLGLPSESFVVCGPATVTAIVQRKGSETYLLTWKNSMNKKEVKDEQVAVDLYHTQKTAQMAADKRHNAALRRRMR